MIPLYVLIGVWGGPGRLGATYKFVVYTVAGSLLMLVAIIARPLAGHVRPRRAAARGRSTMIFLGFLAAFAVKAPLWPVPRLAARRLPRVLAGGGCRALGRDLEDCGIRLPAHRDPDSRARGRPLADALLVLASIGLVYGSLSPSVRPTCAA